MKAKKKKIDATDFATLGVDPTSKITTVKVCERVCECVCLCLCVCPLRHTSPLDQKRHTKEIYLFTHTDKWVSFAMNN